MLARILFWWGASILALLLSFAMLAAFIESYEKSGVMGVVVGLVLLSAVPALVIGIIWDKN